MSINVAALTMCIIDMHCEVYIHVLEGYLCSCFDISKSS